MHVFVVFIELTRKQIIKNMVDRKKKYMQVYITIILKILRGAGLCTIDEVFYVVYANMLLYIYIYILLWRADKVFEARTYAHYTPTDNVRAG